MGQESAWHEPVVVDVASPATTESQASQASVTLLAVRPVGEALQGLAACDEQECLSGHAGVSTGAYSGFPAAVAASCRVHAFHAERKWVVDAFRPRRRGPSYFFRKGSNKSSHGCF